MKSKTKTQIQRKILNSTFCIMACAFIVVPSLVSAHTIINYSNTGPKYISLENRLSTQPVSITSTSFSEGEFQYKFEKALEDALPLKSEASLYNATLQEKFIKASAGQFEIDLYPTYYGSKHAYDSRNDAIVPFPNAKSKSKETTMFNSLDAINEIAAQYPNINMYYYNAPHSAYLESNPLHDLISSSKQANTSIDDKIYAHLNPPVVYLNSVIESKQTNNEFRTEHHWDINGAFQFYCGALAVIQPNSSPIKTMQQEKFDVPFYGSYARVGLCIPNSPDYISDIRYNESSLSVYINSEQGSLEDLRHRNLYSDRGWSNDPYTLRYEEYFHWNTGLIEITNNDIASNENLLIIGDSYKNNLERFFAENYHIVYSIDPRNFEGSISSFIESHDISDILFLFSPASLELSSVQTMLAN